MLGKLLTALIFAVALLPFSNSVALHQVGAKATPNCGVLKARQIDKQANPRAARLVAECNGQTASYIPSAKRNALSRIKFTDKVSATKAAVSAEAFVGSDINLITGNETFPRVTQAGSMIWGDGDDVVSVYNDTQNALTSYSGMSVSDDGAVNFSRLDPNPFDTVFTDDIGDPAVAFDKAAGKWLALALTSDCGEQGVGLMSTTTPAAPDSWAVETCPHSGSADDRPIIWVDNNAASSLYGRRYISFNDFSDGALKLLWSVEGGSWTEVEVAAGSATSFIRNVHITGSMETDGTVFIFAMNEGGGGDASRLNWIYRSTDGGLNWTPTQLGPSYPPAGAGLCSGSDYFYMMPPVWRHMGWGQGAVGLGGIVHYVYSRAGSAPGDLGDIYYIRSTDNGSSWSTAVVLNTDALNKNNAPQWQPSISATAQGAVLVGWYDRRNTTDGLNYQYYGRLSLDGGGSFLPDKPISDVIIPQPTQVDPAKSFCFAGNSNFHSGLGNASLVTWTDGRNAIATEYPALRPEEQLEAQMDVYFKRLNLCPAISVESATLPNGRLTVAYNQTVTGIGGTTPYAFALSGALPGGLVFNENTGEITGTPTSTGIVPFSIIATDSFGCEGAQDYNLIVDPALVTNCPAIILTPLTLPGGAQGALYEEAVTADGGVASYDYSVTAGALPVGVLLDPLTGDISGVPQESGDFSFSVTATDANQCTGTLEYMLDQAISIQCPTITLSPPKQLPDSAKGLPYLTNITANGGTAPYKFFPQSATPKGVFYSEGGTIFGVNESPGSKNTTIAVVDANGCTGSADFRLDSTNCPDGALFCDAKDIASKYSKTNRCGGETHWYDTQNCPSSNNIGHTPSSHARWGVPPAADGSNSEDCSSYSFGAATQDALESAEFDVANCTSGEVILNFNYLMGFDNDASSTRVRVEVVADSGAVEVVADNGAGDAVCSGPASPGIGNLKPWSGWQHLELTHPATSTFAFNFVAETDNEGDNKGEGFYIDDVVLQCKCPIDFIMKPEFLPNATVNVGYVEAIIAEGGLEPYKFGTLPGHPEPSGLTLDPDTGVLFGVPTTAGIHPFTVEATDGNFCKTSIIYNLTVSPQSCPAISLLDLKSNEGIVDIFYAGSVAADGGDGTYAYAVTVGELPPGLSLNPETGDISGTPTTAGIFAFTVSVVDGLFCNGGQDYIISINPLDCPELAITPESLPNPDTRLDYSELLSADGGTTPYLWAITDGVLPSGLSLATDTGEISGLATSGGLFSFDITVQDADLCLGTRPYSVEVQGCPVISVTPIILPNAVNGTAYSETIVADGGAGSYTYTVATGSLPTGLSLDPGTGTLSGTPTVNGTYSFDISAEDGDACTGVTNYTVTVGDTFCPTISIAPSEALPMLVGNAYSQPFVPTGGVLPYSYSISSGTLPGGLTLDPAKGVVSGTPDTYGTFPFEVMATDANACVGVNSYSLEDRSCAGIERNKTIAANFGPGMHLCIGFETLDTSGAVNIAVDAVVYFQSPAATLDSLFNVSQQGMFRVGPVGNAAPYIFGPAVLTGAIGATLDFSTSHTCEDFENGSLAITPADSGMLTADPQEFTLSCADNLGKIASMLVTVNKK